MSHLPLFFPYALAVDTKFAFRGSTHGGRRTLTYNLKKAVTNGPIFSFSFFFGCRCINYSTTVYRITITKLFWFIIVYYTWCYRVLYINFILTVNTNEQISLQYIHQRYTEYDEWLLSLSQLFMPHITNV